MKSLSEYRFTAIVIINKPPRLCTQAHPSPPRPPSLPAATVSLARTPRPRPTRALPAGRRQASRRPKTSTALSGSCGSAAPPACSRQRAKAEMQSGSVNESSLPSKEARQDRLDARGEQAAPSEAGRLYASGAKTRRSGASSARSCSRHHLVASDPTSRASRTSSANSTSTLAGARPSSEHQPMMHPGPAESFGPRLPPSATSLASLGLGRLGPLSTPQTSWPRSCSVSQLRQTYGTVCRGLCSPGRRGLWTRR